MLFKNKKVFFSCSVTTIMITKTAPKDLDPGFAKKLVAYLKANGAKVPNEHVVEDSFEELIQAAEKNSGVQLTKIAADRKRYSQTIRKIDMGWLDSSTHHVVLIDHPSFGVGMELERALYRHHRNLSILPILILIPREKYKTTSAMVIGIGDHEHPNVQIKTFTTLASAKRLIREFLL